MIPELRLGLVALILLALALTGFAHRAPDAGLARFLAAGGDLTAICADGPGRASHHDDEPCEACRLVEAVLSAPPSTHANRPPVRVVAVALPGSAIPFGTFRVSGRGPRAPPIA